MIVSLTIDKPFENDSLMRSNKDDEEASTCNICLEKMVNFLLKKIFKGYFSLKTYLKDESLSCIVTVLCNHSFHADCLFQWGETCVENIKDANNCPVCKFSQTPDFSEENTCTDCGSNEVYNFGPRYCNVMFWFK